MEGTQSLKDYHKKPPANLENDKLVNITCMLYIIWNKGS